MPIFPEDTKSLAEFAAIGGKQNPIIFGRGVYVDENTAQAASVEFVRLWRTNYARSRLQKSGENPLLGFSPVKKSHCAPEAQ